MLVIAIGHIMIVRMDVRRSVVMRMRVLVFAVMMVLGVALMSMARPILMVVCLRRRSIAAEPKFFK